jgi:hypothetical protein
MVFKQGVEPRAPPLADSKPLAALDSLYTSTEGRGGNLLVIGSLPPRSEDTPQ